MVKKLTGAAFLLLVTINHCFCDIKPNKNQDQANKNIEKTDNPSSKIKKNKKADQKTNVTSVLSGISTTLLVLERLAFVLTGKSFTFQPNPTPAPLEDINTSYLSDLRPDIVMDILKKRQAIKKCPLLWKYVNDPASTTRIINDLKTSVTPEGYKTAMLAICSDNYKHIPKDGHMHWPEKVIYHLNNYLKANKYLASKGLTNQRLKIELNK